MPVACRSILPAIGSDKVVFKQMADNSPKRGQEEYFYSQRYNFGFGELRKCDVHAIKNTKKDSCTT